MQAKWNGLGLSKLWLVILARCYLFLTKIRKIHAHIFRAIWWVFLTTHHLLFILNASLKFRANDSSLPKIKRPFNDKIVCNYISELWFLVFYTSAFGFDPARAHGGGGGNLIEHWIIIFIWPLTKYGRLRVSSKYGWIIAGQSLFKNICGFTNICLEIPRQIVMQNLSWARLKQPSKGPVSLFIDSLDLTWWGWLPLTC